jgi:hypothetical protein
MYFVTRMKDNAIYRVLERRLLPEGRPHLRLHIPVQP